MLKRRQNEVKRNIFLFDEVKNIAGRIPEATRSTKTSQKAEAITFCIKPFTHYLPGSDLKIGEI